MLAIQVRELLVPFRSVVVERLRVDAGLVSESLTQELQAVTPQLKYCSIAACLFLAGTAAAQISNAAVLIGGPGACGSEGGDPPLLSNNTPASASLRVFYDASIGVLQVEVTNTSAVVGNDANPLLTQLYFNLPRGALTGIVLTGQAGSGGADPAFVPTFDLETGAGPEPNRAGSLGSFGVCLRTGPGSRGGISNAAATVVGGPPGAAVRGPVRFTFQLHGPSLAQLGASAFAQSGSFGGSACRNLTAAAKFQAGGPNAEGSAWIGTSSGCVPGAFHVGQPCLGNTITFTMSGAPGCVGCLIMTVNPTPTPFLGYLVPAGPPYVDLFGGQIGPNGALTRTLTIPQNPNLVGMTVYYFTVLAENGSLVFSTRQSLTVCP